jgi:pSer/pThr/pTyr-binding forkhead associated (FHA) protein
VRPVDILQVSDGQDRGARFGFPGSQATIGRGPTMDMVLTDPETAPCHAVLRV